MVIKSLLLILATSIGVCSIPWTESSFFPATSPYHEWIPEEGFVLQPTWQMPENTCFEAHVLERVHDDTYYKWDPINECSICTGAVNSPGFHIDPNDCSKFFHCARNIQGDWVPYHKQCPKCQFWKQEDLACVWVYNGPICYATTTEGPSTPATSPTTTEFVSTLPPPAPTFLDTCVNFDHGWNKIQGLKWIWVWGQNTETLNSHECLNNGRCGYFNGHSKLEIPRFSNAFQYQRSFSISLFYKRRGGGSTVQGILSNGCFTSTLTYDEASSVFISSSLGHRINIGVRAIDGSTGLANNIYAPEEEWHHVVMSWNGTFVDFYLDKELLTSTPFTGPLRNSHCPMVIGDFINSGEYNKFVGYIDEICIFRKGLNQEEVNQINMDPTYSYGWTNTPA